MADTTNATYDGGIDVPHCSLSGANISIKHETSKQFPKFNIKQMDAGPENLHPLCIELLQELSSHFYSKEIFSISRYSISVVIFTPTFTRFT